MLHIQLCLTLCLPTDCSPPAFPVHRIFQVRILESVAISSSRGASWTRVSCVTCIAGGFFTCWALGEAPMIIINIYWCSAGAGPSTCLVPPHLFLTTPSFRYKDWGSGMWKDEPRISRLKRGRARGKPRQSGPRGHTPVTVCALTSTSDTRRDSNSKGKACPLTDTVSEYLQEWCTCWRYVQCTRWHMEGSS